jgi:hypothetical protein
MLNDDIIIDDISGLKYFKESDPGEIQRLIWFINSGGLDKIHCQDNFKYLSVHLIKSPINYKEFKDDFYRGVPSFNLKNPLAIKVKKFLFKNYTDKNQLKNFTEIYGNPRCCCLEINKHSNLRWDDEIGDAIYDTQTIYVSLKNDKETIIIKQQHKSQDISSNNYNYEVKQLKNDVIFKLPKCRDISYRNLISYREMFGYDNVFTYSNSSFKEPEDFSRANMSIINKYLDKNFNTSSYLFNEMFEEYFNFPIVKPEIHETKYTRPTHVILWDKNEPYGLGKKVTWAEYMRQHED